jgi:gliding motility-associated-like protein
MKNKEYRCFCFYYGKLFINLILLKTLIFRPVTTSAQKNCLISDAAFCAATLSVPTGYQLSYTFLKVPYLKNNGDEYCSVLFVGRKYLAVNNSKDSIGCIAPTILNDPYVVLDASCGAADGAITIRPVSGIAPFKYSIDGGRTYVEGPAAGYTFINLARGSYQLRLKDAGGCESEVIEKRVRMIYRGPTFLTNVEDEISCIDNNGKIEIKPIRGVPPFMYSLDAGTTYFPGPDSGYVFSNLSATTYFPRVKDSGECESEYVRSVVNYIYFEAKKTNLNISICSGDSYLLPWGRAVNAAGVYSNSVPYNGVICDSLISTVNITVRPPATDTIINVSILQGETYTFSRGGTVSNAGYYIDTVKYSGANCDSIIKKLNLTIIPRPIQATTVASICSGSSYVLPSGKSVNIGGIYKDTVRYPKGYDSLIATVNLSVKTPLRINKTVLICEGESLKLSSGKIIKKSGVYCDTIGYVSGCDSSITSINLIVKPLPSPTLVKSNDINCIMESSILSASGGNRYIWGPPVSIGNVCSPKVVVSPSVTTMYKVTAVDVNGCVAEDSIEVKVDKQGQEGGYLLPGAFTPNNDGKNDCFGVRSWTNITNLKFQIYNRWGALVFETNDPSMCWNGTYKGRLQGNEAFVYQISARTLCGGQINRRGTVVLIR